MAKPSAQVVAFHLRIPLIRPFVTATGVVGQRDLCLVRASNGFVVGWGEAAPYPGQDETFEELVESIQADEPSATLFAGIDEALSDVSARLRGVPLLDTPASVPLCIAVGLEHPVETVDDHVAAGIGNFKLKVAPGRVGHVGVIRSRHPEVVLGVDGNGAFGAGRMLELESMAGAGLAFAEEIFDEWRSHEVLQFTERTGVPLFADESARDLTSITSLLATPGVEGITIKPGRLGWGGSLAARDLVRSAGKQWRASGLLETSIGRSFTNRLAALPDAVVSDVAPASMFLTEDVAPEGVHEGSLLMRDGPGIGFHPDMDIVDRYLVGEYDLGQWALASG